MKEIPFTAPDFSGGPVKFLVQVREELKKVIWPTRKELIRMTITVIAVSLLVGVYIGLLDYGFAKLVELVIKR